MSIMGEKTFKAGLIGTKYNAPEMNPYLVSRRRLDQKLNHALECRLTLVIAPAGCGKTTAVLDWIETNGLPSAWMSLDAGDNDPPTFWRYVCAALDGIAEGIGGDTEYVFSSMELFKANIHLSILIDRLMEAPSDFVFVLDDLHLIGDPEILAGLSYLIDYMPAKMHLVFISRTEPALQLPRHRVKWQVMRLAEEDLLFEEDEILNFCKIRGIHLENTELKKVESYTEGWAAALVAIALSVQEGGGHDAIRSLSRAGRDINQYLRDEVIRTWPPERRSFAMKTSVLNTLSVGLCDAVTDSGNGRMLLEIYETGGFLTDLDGRRQLFRYHSLFRSFLRALLQETAPDAVSGLHLRAGAWFKEQGMTPEAIEHYLSGGFFDEAFELIEEPTEHLVQKNDYGRLLSWIERLPERYTANSFKIAIFYAFYYAETGQYELSRQWVGRLKTMQADPRFTAAPGWHSYSRTACALTEANLLVREGKLNLLPSVIAAAESNDSKYFKMIDYNDFNASDIYFYRCPFNGLLKYAGQALDQFDRITDTYRALISKNPGYAPLITGEYFYETNGLDKALPYLIKAVDEAKAAECPGALVPAMVTISRMKRAQGDMTGAFGVLEECERILRGYGKAHWIYLVRSFRCRLFMDAGDAEKAREWLSSSKLGIFMELSKIREFELIVYARVLISVNRTQDAELLLRRLLSFTTENGRLHSRVEVLNLLAMLTFRNHQMRFAYSHLDESLEIGMKEGYVRSYLDELSPMAQLLRAYIKSRGKRREGALSDERPAYAAGLLKQMHGSVLQSAEACDKAAAGMAPKLLEQLTEQEKKVLELLINAATNQEIGEKLGISLRTVKTHTGNIYGKLGVKNRAQCVKMARETKLP